VKYDRRLIVSVAGHVASASRQVPIDFRSDHFEKYPL